MQVKFSIFFHHGSLNVIGDKFRFVKSKLKSSFDFFSFTQIFIIGHKGIIFFPEKKILLQIAFFQLQKGSIEIFL
jgi:hypothetical protein